MYHYLLIPLLLSNLAWGDMKCSDGKCGSSMKETTPKIEKVMSKADVIKKESNKKPTITQLFNVTTVKIKSVNRAKTQVNYGYIVASDDAKVDVTAWYSGFVEKLYADTLYTYVKKDEALAKVYSPEVYKAKQDYLNSLTFNNTHTSSGMLKSAETKLLLLGVDKKEIAQIRKSRKADTLTTIYAPISGWIFEKNISQGSSFSSKKRLFQIVNLDSVWMEVKLFQHQLKELHLYQDFSVTIKGIEEVYLAKKSLLYPIINPKEATTTLRLILDNNKGKLKVGMYAKVSSRTLSKERLSIPRTAVIRKGGKWYAFLATEFKGEYEPIVIEVKPLDKLSYQVTKGLTLQDTVVNNALFMMDSDAQINSIY